MPRLNDPWIHGALWVLASPMFFFQAVLRARRQYHFFRMAIAAATPCECGEMLSLVGFWKCSCSFTYQGHLLRRCPVCFSVPCMIRCYRCGVTTKLPEDD